jgi:hypothetical protein
MVSSTIWSVIIVVCQVFIVVACIIGFLAPWLVHGDGISVHLLYTEACIFSVCITAHYKDGEVFCDLDSIFELCQNNFIIIVVVVAQRWRSFRTNVYWRNLFNYRIGFYIVVCGDVVGDARASTRLDRRAAPNAGGNRQRSVPARNALSSAGNVGVSDRLRRRNRHRTRAEHRRRAAIRRAGVPRCAPTHRRRRHRSTRVS